MTLCRVPRSFAFCANEWAFDSTKTLDRTRLDLDCPFLKLHSDRFRLAIQVSPKTNFKNRAGGPHCQWEVSLGLCRSVDRNQNGGARLLALFEKSASRRECPSWRFQTLFNAVADAPLSGVLQHSGNTSRVSREIATCKTARPNRDQRQRTRVSALHYPSRRQNKLMEPAGGPLKPVSA